jgi:hypothetical protein
MPSHLIETDKKPLLAWILLPILAAVAIIPLIRVGCSCGHDIGFHLQSWLDAAQQLKRGNVYPSWASSPAFNAGEPRFLFYPPLSWMLGEFLTLLLPFRAVPVAYTWLVLAAAGLSMHAVVRRLTHSDPAALLVAALYLANPYMLFTALERTAYAELLAAVWLPWLLLAALKHRPTAPALAIPLALLWLTNAPAAVMGSYTLLVLAGVRVAVAMRNHIRPWQLVRTFVGGATLGLLLPAFFLVPAIYEQRFVQITMALVPGLSVPNNFLFAHSADAGHDIVNHQASHLAVAILLATFAALLLAIVLNRRVSLQASAADSTRKVMPFTALVSFGLLLFLIAFMLEPPSKVLWLHLPELAFLQFPWRLLMVLAAVLALALAIALSRLLSFSEPIAIVLAFAGVITMTFSLSHLYLYSCDADETPAATARLFYTSHGVSATDEYTPNGADNDVLRFDNPGYWLTTDPNAPAPGTIPNPNATQPDVDFGQPQPTLTLSEMAPHHMVVTVSKPEFLVFNLRDFHNWHVNLTSADSLNQEGVQRVQRDDGLLAIALRHGTYTVDIHWLSSPDRYLGAFVTFIAVNILLFCIFASRRIVQ